MLLYAIHLFGSETLDGDLVFGRSPDPEELPKIEAFRS